MRYFITLLFFLCVQSIYSQIPDETLRIVCGKYIFDIETQRGIVPIFVEIKSDVVTIDNTIYKILSYKKIIMGKSEYKVIINTNDMLITLYCINNELIAIELSLKSKKKEI